MCDGIGKRHSACIQKDTKSCSQCEDSLFLPSIVHQTAHVVDMTLADTHINALTCGNGKGPGKISDHSWQLFEPKRVDSQETLL